MAQPRLGEPGLAAAHRWEARSGLGQGAHQQAAAVAEVHDQPHLVLGLAIGARAPGRNGVRARVQLRRALVHDAAPVVGRVPQRARRGAVLGAKRQPCASPRLCGCAPAGLAPRARGPRAAQQGPDPIPACTPTVRSTARAPSSVTSRRAYSRDVQKCASVAMMLRCARPAVMTASSGMPSLQRRFRLRGLVMICGQSSAR